jgi:hypothetical protein
MWRDVAYRPLRLCYLGAKAVSIGAKQTWANAFSRFLRGKTAARFSAFCNGQIVERQRYPSDRPPQASAVTRHRRDFLADGEAMGFASAHPIRRAAPHDAHVSDSIFKQRISDAHLQSRGADSARVLQSLSPERVRAQGMPGAPSAPAASHAK